jgi:microcystin-dependent protein
MSDYNKSTNFTTKDTLPTGNSQKLVKGTELDIEFTNIASAVASKADSNSPTLTGTPITPTAPLGTNTTQIASCAFAITNGIPSGCIVLWSGTIISIPTGWVLCNGASGTPDLRDRFVVGAGSSYAVGATGGATTATLSTPNLPSHTHSISASGTTGTESVGHTHSGTTNGQSVDHSHSGTTGGMNSNNPHSHNNAGTGALCVDAGSTPGYDNGGLYGNIGLGQTTTSTDINHTHNFSTGGTSVDHNHSFSTGDRSAAHTHTVTVTGTSGATGSATAFSILPPYYALAYIMKS